MDLAIQADDVRAAAERIRPLARRTPVMTSDSFDAAADKRVFFKCENLQRGGAFKIRGASNLILSLPEEALVRGIVTYSSGNHAQAVAIASKHVGAQATIVMPEDAPRSKLEATRAQGAKIVTYNRRTETRETIAAQILQETGATLVPPFDHPMIMAGQGTAALELLEDAGQLDALIAPVGGGGLISGCSTIAKAMNADVRIFGVEPEGANDTFLSLAAGERVTVASRYHRRWPPLAASRRAYIPGGEAPRGAHHPGERRRDSRRRQILVTAVEDSGRAQRRGGGGGAARRQVAADEIRSVGVVLSGGNVDFEELAKY